MPTFETIGDEWEEPVMAAQAGTIMLNLPKDAALEAMMGADALYQCENYSFWVQTMPSGDVQGTIKTLSGFAPSMLTVMQSGDTNRMRYEWTWSATGEEGDLVFRACVIDDGKYHYCITAMSDAMESGNNQKAWNDLFASFSVS